MEEEFTDFIDLLYFSPILNVLYQNRCQNQGNPTKDYPTVLGLS